MNMKTQQQGFSLVEIMIAMLIGLFLLMGLTTVMINSKKTYNSQADRVTLQENARFAFEYMAKDIRMNGYFGCAGETPKPVDTDPDDQYAMRAINNEGANGSDSLHVAYADPARNAFLISYDTGTTPFTLGKTTFQPSEIVNFGALADEDDVVIFDCQSIELFKDVDVSSTNQLILKRNSTDTSTGLSREYANQDNSSTAEMRRLLDYTYVVRPINEDGELIVDESAPYSYALFRIEGDVDITTAGNVTRENAELVVEGVENMQLRFGIDKQQEGEDGYEVPDQYVTIANVGSWPVVSVKITLLMATLDERRELDLDTNTYILDANDFPAATPYNPTPDDYRRRSVFSMVVKLRNKTGD